MSEKIIFIAKKFLKNAQNFAICEFFRAGFPTRAVRRPVYLQLRGPFVFPCAETCPKKLTYRGFLCQNEKFRGNKNYFLRHSGPNGLPTGKPPVSPRLDSCPRFHAQVFQVAHATRNLTGKRPVICGTLYWVPNGVGTGPAKVHSNDAPSKHL